ncbi:MAG: hypothetical protein R2845_08000 [Thermomicrobiales bacterium]
MAGSEDVSTAALGHLQDDIFFPGFPGCRDASSFRDGDEVVRSGHLFAVD